MARLTLARQRQLVWSIGFVTLIALGLWIWSPGLPVIWGPSARASDIVAGQELFEHEWQPNDPKAHGDGLGPVFNAKSCASCHFQGGLGGGGELAHNATTYEVHSRPGEPEFITGSLHSFSVLPQHRETRGVLKSVFPVIPSRDIGTSSCKMIVPEFNPVSTQSVQATALFGAGWIDLISDKAIHHNQRSRQLKAVRNEMSLDFSNVPVGRVPMTADGSVGKFGWKGQHASLSDFVAAACANELGLGTPAMAQVAPLADRNYTSEPDLDKKQFRQLVAFVKTLPKPVETNPDDATTAHGKEMFRSVGCATCHTPNMGGVKGVYSDFLLYNLHDPSANGDGYGPNPPKQLELAERPRHLPQPEEWKTPALWGVADSAPYFHDGSAPTLESAIQRHRGDAKLVTTNYQGLNKADQAALLAFLNSLKAPPDAKPLSNPAVVRLGR